MNTITIEGKTYSYKVRGGAVKSFEKKTGYSIFKIDQDSIGDFTSLSDFILLCVNGLTEPVLDEVELNEQIEILGEILSGKKRKASVQESTISNDLPTQTDAPSTNGQELFKTQTSTSQNSSYKPLSEEEINRRINGIPEG